MNGNGLDDGAGEEGGAGRVQHFPVGSVHFPHSFALLGGDLLEAGDGAVEGDVEGLVAWFREDGPGGELQVQRPIPPSTAVENVVFHAHDEIGVLLERLRHPVVNGLLQDGIQIAIHTAFGREGQILGHIRAHHVVLEVEEGFGDFGLVHVMLVDVGLGAVLGDDLVAMLLVLRHPGLDLFPLVLAHACGAGLRSLPYPPGEAVGLGDRGGRGRGEIGRGEGGIMYYRIDSVTGARAWIEAGQVDEMEAEESGENGVDDEEASEPRILRGMPRHDWASVWENESVVVGLRMMRRIGSILGSRSQ